MPRNLRTSSFYCRAVPTCFPDFMGLEDRPFPVTQEKFQLNKAFFFFTLWVIYSPECASRSRKCRFFPRTNSEFNEIQLRFLLGGAQVQHDLRPAWWQLRGKPERHIFRHYSRSWALGKYRYFSSWVLAGGMSFSLPKNIASQGPFHLSSAKPLRHSVGSTFCFSAAWWENFFPDFCSLFLRSCV